MRLPKSISILILSLLSAIPLTHAYDRDGHEAVGMVAMSGITKGKVLNTLKRLLRGKDAMDISGWAHLVDNKYEWAKQFHYQRYKLGPKPDSKIMTAEKVYEHQCNHLELLTDTETNCEGNFCLSKILEHFYASVSTPEGDPSRIPVQFPGGVQFTDADAIKFLVNLVADMHMPVHYVPVKTDQSTASLINAQNEHVKNHPDEYNIGLGIEAKTIKDKKETNGYMTKVKVPVGMRVRPEPGEESSAGAAGAAGAGAGGADSNGNDAIELDDPHDKTIINLYDLYDKGLVHWVKSANPTFWDSGWTSIQRGGSMVHGFNGNQIFTDEQSELAKDYKQFPKFLHRWAKESAVYACLNVYRDPVSKKLIPSQHFQIPHSDLEIWRNDVLKRILTAGARVAILINAIVENHHLYKEGIATGTSAQADPAVPAIGKADLQSGTALSDIVDPVDKGVLKDIIPDIPEQLNLHKGPRGHRHGGSGGGLTNSWKNAFHWDHEHFRNLLINLTIFMVELALLLAWLAYTAPVRLSSSIELADVNGGGGKTLNSKTI